MWDTLYRLYLVLFLAGAPLGYVVIQIQAVAGNAGRLDPVRLAALRADLGGWLPAVLALLCLAGLWLATWLGPVVMEDADIAWLLSTPIPRARLIRGRLARGLLVGTGMGAGAGALVWLGLVAMTPSPAAPLLAACVGCVGALGASAAAAAWAVECRNDLAPAVMRASLPVAGASAVVAAFSDRPVIGAAAR